MTCDTLGIYSRSVADLELVSSVFQLLDDTPIPTTPFAISGSKIAFVKTHVWPKAGLGLEKAWEKAKSLLEGRGADVEEIELPKEFERITKWHADVLAGEGRTSFLGSELYSSFHALQSSWIALTLTFNRLFAGEG
jgi:Asp-tRNA(Asn)/Glu-tRNA(Gln) amidotransferase A subunit family amidase